MKGAKEGFLGIRPKMVSGSGTKIGVGSLLAVTVGIPSPECTRWINV